MQLYRLYVKLGEKWEMVCSVQSPDWTLAFREAVRLLKPEHRGKPMSLCEDGKLPPNDENEAAHPPPP